MEEEQKQLQQNSKPSGIKVETKPMVKPTPKPLPT